MHVNYSVAKQLWK